MDALSGDVFATRKSINVRLPFSDLLCADVGKASMDGQSLNNNSLPSLLQSKLPPEVNRILYVRNLPFNISAEDLYAIFGKYGAVYQIRLGNKDKDTRGTALVVYEDIYDAKSAVDHLSGFNVGGRYLVVLYYQPAKFQRRAEADEKEKELQLLRKKVEQHKKNISSSSGT
jgi:pre-mRNA branch site protein p14